MCMRLLARLAACEDGQTMAEYAVTLTVIAVGIIMVLGVISGKLADAFQFVADAI